MRQLHRSVKLPCRQVRSRLTRPKTRTSEKLDKPLVPARSQAARCASIALYAAYWCVPFMRGLLLGPRFGSDRPLQGGNSRITDVGSGSLWKALHSDPERSFEAYQSGHLPQHPVQWKTWKYFTPSNSAVYSVALLSEFSCTSSNDIDVFANLLQAVPC